MEPLEPSVTGATLLIVEDEVLVAMTLKSELEDAGFHVLDLTDRPGEALAAAQACKPALALVNIELHGRDDGIPLAREFKAMDIPVLFISGQISQARSAQSVAVGSLPKPYHPAHMVMAVNYLLRHLEGDESLPRPQGLEVFAENAAEMEPDEA
ncbi:response regulator [Phenylobacterium sp.]|uniref:response regulator n=1 Tax=Phenylobacterium sp. TaxID=1871053 RepID=UPI0039832C9E